MMRAPAFAILALALVGCASTGTSSSQAPASGRTVGSATAAAAHVPRAQQSPRRVSPYAPAQEDPNTRGHYVAGGLYRPGVADTVPSYIPNVDAIPEPEVVHVERSRYGNRSPYTVLGQQYTVLDDHSGFVEEGLASYYGNKFHGRRTSNQEVYDMYAFTAAHKSLPLPSFARVTNLDNGKSVVVRVNDRGPFHEGRVIDLSYAAAVKLGYRETGTARVQVQALLPGDASLPPAIGTRVASTAPNSAMDGLVAALPAPSAASVQPAALAPVQTAASTSTASSTVVAAVPASTPAATSVATQAAANPNPNGERFNLYQNGRALTADEFDAWMAQRGLRVATGQVTHLPGNSAPAAPSLTPLNAAPSAAPALANGITLQVASFADHNNANNALSRLRSANIADALLQDGMVNGRRIWRLRIGPVDPAQAPDLIARVAGLGMGTPQQVRD